MTGTEGPLYRARAERTSEVRTAREVVHRVAPAGPQGERPRATVCGLPAERQPAVAPNSAFFELPSSVRCALCADQGLERLDASQDEAPPGADPWTRRGLVIKWALGMTPAVWVGALKYSSGPLEATVMTSGFLLVAIVAGLVLVWTRRPSGPAVLTLIGAALASGIASFLLFYAWSLQAEAARTRYYPEDSALLGILMAMTFLALILGLGLFVVAAYRGVAVAGNEVVRMLHGRRA